MASSRRSRYAPAGSRIIRRRYWSEWARNSVTRMAVPRAGASAMPTALTDGQSERLEVAQDGVLAIREVALELLQRVGDAVPIEESDEVPRRADGDRAEAHLVRVPRLERLLPRQIEQRAAGVAEAQAREGGGSARPNGVEQRRAGRGGRRDSTWAGSRLGLGVQRTGRLRGACGGRW